MRYLYYCNSAYQVLNALNLNWHRKYANFENIDDYHADLVLLNAFDDAKDMIDKIKTLNDFDNVYLANRVRNAGIFHALKTTYNIINPYHYIEKSGIENPKQFKDYYDVITVPKFSKLTAAFSKINKDAKIHLYEDGFGTYYDDVKFDAKSKFYNLFYHIFGYSFFYKFDFSYLNKKELYCGDSFDRIKEIPNFNKNYINTISNIFKKNYDNNEKKIFWFGQFIVDDVNDIISKLLSSSYKSIAIYKPHPRYILPVNEIDNLDYKGPWELYALGINDIENKCFITINSTAVLTPKILYNFETYIIFTYKLLKDYSPSYLDIAIEKFISTYKNKEKIMIPSNKKEFEECLSKYIKKIN